MSSEYPRPRDYAGGRQDIARSARRRDTEATMAREGGAVLGDDKGLDFIIPLLMFLHKPCHKAVCHFLMRHFRDADYVTKNINTHEKRKMTLKIFLEQANKVGEEIRKEKADKKTKKGKQKNKNNKDNPPQQQQQPSAEGKQRRDYVPNIPENEEILNSITVGGLMQGDKACLEELERLDICFVLNIIFHSVIDISMHGLEKFFYEFKEVRKVLVHPNFSFTKEDFNKNFQKLVAAAEELYKYLALDEQELQKSKENCCRDARTGNKALLIHHCLAKEIHEKYIPPDSTFVPPDITLLKTSGQEVLKQDLNKFIESQHDQKNLIMLSGEHREEKARLMEGLAFTFKSHKKFKLVLHVNERNRKHSHSMFGTEAIGEHCGATFQDQVFDCIAHLAPRTVYKYGLDIVKAVIRVFQKDVLFIVNWHNLGHVSTELQKGTWVLTYEGKEPPLADWQVLRLELYTEAQVLKMIDYHICKEKKKIGKSCSKEMLKDVVMACYNRLDNKNILSSFGMIQIFLEVYSCGSGSVASDFDLVKIYVENSLKGFEGDEQVKENMVRLGENAYTSLNKSGFINKGKIPQCLLESFLYHVEGKGWSFRHSIVRDFMIAKYFVSKWIKARREWVNTNVVTFKRVFKFACFLWCRSDTKETKYLPYMEEFLRIFLSAPKKEDNTEDSLFDSWDLLFDLDDACVGSRKIMKPLLSTLSDIPCWCFNADKCQGLDKRLIRMDKILKGEGLTLKKDNPLIMKLKSTNTNMKLITKFWKKLRQIPAMYDCVRIEVTVEGEDTSHRNEVEDFFKTVADTDVPLHITQYKGPLFPSIMFKCLKGECMQNLEILEVCVNDVSSLKEVLLCGAKEMHIMVNIERPEESNFTSSSIVFPSVGSVHISLKYFHNIQQLLDGFQGCHQLRSLSIHDVYIPSNFKLDLLAFSHLESFDIMFEPETVDCRPLPPEEDRMEEGGECNGHRQLPQSNWLSHLLLPENFKMIPLRVKDSNQNLINELSEKYSFKKVVNLDTHASLTRDGQTHCSQIDDEKEEEENHKGGKRLQMKEFPDMGESTKRKRLTEEKCNAMNS